MSTVIIGSAAITVGTAQLGAQILIHPSFTIDLAKKFFGLMQSHRA